MDFFNIWVVPPLVGAIIGYITNWLAIKMLFRPLEAHRLFGLRLPFTPGLLPRERTRLSRSIGHTVANELLTEDVVRKRLAEPDVREALAGAIGDRLREAFASRAADALPGKNVARTALGKFASEAWTSAVSSEAFRDAVVRAVMRAIDAAEDWPLSRFMPPEKAEDLASILLSSSNVEKVRGRLSAFVDGLYDGREDGAEASVARLVPPEAIEPLLEVIASGLYRASLPALEAFLDEPEVRLTLESHGRDIVRNAIGRLNILQRLIVGAAQYERSISESMPRTVDDMIAAALDVLRGQEMPGRAGRAAVAAFRKAVGAPLSASMARVVSRETAKAAVGAALDALERHGPGVARRAAALAAARADASLASIVRALGLPEEEIASRAALALSRALAGSAGGEDAAKLLSVSLDAFVEGLGASLGETSLGDALGTTGASRDELASYLTDRVLDLVSREAGRIVEGLDVGRIVQERLDELDMREIERIVLEVAGKELKWITLLGGILGGAIGIAQSAFMYLRP